MSEATTSAGATESALFQCGSCKRQYKRLDHLARHVRSHTQTKPYSCRICSKAFARADILKRHMAGHEGQGSTSRRTMSQSTGNDVGRVTQACRACSTQHLRCAEEKPCRRCVNKGIECQWNQPVESTLTPPLSAVSPVGDPYNNIQQHGHDSIQVGGSVTAVEQSQVQTPGLHHLPTIHDPMNPHNVNTAPGFFPDWNLLPGQWTPMGTSNFELAPNLDLDDIDLRFLDSYNLRIPFELGSDTLPDAPPAPPADPSADPCHTAAICTEAFKNSHWRFRPKPHDNGGAEEHNLSLPPTTTAADDDRHHHSALESRILLDRRVTCARLSVSTRDKILTMIVESCRPANLARAVASFPSVELLDSLLQYSLANPVARYDEFLHTGSFNPNEQRVELVASMAAAGAVLTADPALTKLGYAIQECLRIAVPKHWESDNTLIRDLQLLQAFFITLDIGLWSGHGRKVEIAESFLQPLLTMLRRGGKLRRSGYPKIILEHGEEPDAAARTWRAWVQQESFKRTALRMMQHDAEMSMALLVNPLISYAEAQLPLPSPERLWRAGSASQWAGEYLAHEGGSHAAVADLLDDPEKLHIHRDIIDAPLASYAFLSCVWRLSWEYIQLDSVRKGHHRQWNALVMASRHEELIRLAARFRVSVDMNMLYAQDLLMKLNVTLLHLHMPFEEIQVFAGMEGPEQARIVYPAVLEWVKGESARQAVWFAGQIVRSARMLPRTALQRCTAVMVYHACIALWVYGMLGEGAEQGPGSHGLGVPAGGVLEAAYLDDGESIALQSFTQLGRGHPCIRGLSIGGHYNDSADTVYLCHPHRVIEVIIGILRGNHDGQTLPRLVDQLIQLMTGLQKASRRGGVDE